MAHYSSTLAWKIPWTEEPGGLQFTGSLRVGHEWATSLSLSCIGGENGNPHQCSCMENPRDWGAWWTAIYGVAQSPTRLKWLSSSSIDVCFWLFVTPWTVAHQAPLSMGILQAKILEWVAMSSSKESSQPRDATQVSGITDGFFTIWATREAHRCVFSSVQFSSVVQSCPTLQPHELQHSRPPCPSPTPGVYSNSCPSSRRCHPAISSSVVPFSSCPQSLPSVRVFSNESTLLMRWPKYWSFSFSISPSNEYPGLIPLMGVTITKSNFGTFLSL